MLVYLMSIFLLFSHILNDLLSLSGKIMFTVLSGQARSLSALPLISAYSRLGTPHKKDINSMNVILGLCHRYSGKVVTFQESFFACKRKLLKTSRLLRSTAKFYLSVSHVIAVVRRAVTQPRRSGQLPVAA